jgi:hypothetical protein
MSGSSPPSHTSRRWSPGTRGPGRGPRTSDGPRLALTRSVSAPRREGQTPRPTANGRGPVLGLPATSRLESGLRSRQTPGVRARMAPPEPSPRRPLQGATPQAHLGPEAEPRPATPAGAGEELAAAPAEAAALEPETGRAAAGVADRLIAAGNPFRAARHRCRCPSAARWRRAPMPDHPAPAASSSGRARVASRHRAALDEPRAQGPHAQSPPARPPSGIGT